MYEHIDSLYSWAIQHNPQEIAGILALCVAVLIPIAAIVLACLDFILDHALRYIYEDDKERRPLISWSYKERHTFLLVHEYDWFGDEETVVRIDTEGSYITNPLTVVCISVGAALCSVALYFLPFWLLVTAGTIYGTLRTARFTMRWKKKFDKHLKKEHDDAQVKEG